MVSSYDFHISKNRFCPISFSIFILLMTQGSSIKNSFNNESAMYNNLIEVYKTFISKAEEEKHGGERALSNNPTDPVLRKFFWFVRCECVY